MAAVDAEVFGVFAQKAIECMDGDIEINATVGMQGLMGQGEKHECQKVWLSERHEKAKLSQSKAKLTKP